MVLKKGTRLIYDQRSGSPQPPVIYDKDVILEPAGLCLHVDAPRGSYSLDDLAFLLEHKAEIIALLLDLRRPRLTEKEFADHLLAQVEKAFFSARWAETMGKTDLSWRKRTPIGVTTRSRANYSSWL